MYVTKRTIGLKMLCALLISSVVSVASVKMDGYFIAQKSCEAVHSIKKSTLPFTVTEGMSYQVMAKNRPEATHYLIRIPNLEENANKWVPTSCGIVLTNCKDDQVEKPTKGESYLFAISWQAGFCQSHQTKIECKTQTEDRYDATHLALHGLWPQPRNKAYCNVSNKDKGLDRKKFWSQLEPLHLSENLFSKLLVVMPGVGSYLQRHEWIKHGTCYSDSPERYYSDAIMLLNQINNTPISSLFAEHIGQKLTVQEIRDAFDSAFGKGSGERVNLKCDRKGLITELWINLKGEVSKEQGLSSLLKNAPIVTKIACEGGMVDAVGF